MKILIMKATVADRLMKRGIRRDIPVAGAGVLVIGKDTSRANEGQKTFVHTTTASI
jgi:hypothetical protein